MGIMEPKNNELLNDDPQNNNSENPMQENNSENKPITVIKSFIDNRYIQKLLDLKLNELIDFILSIEGPALTFTLSELGEEKYIEIMSNLDEEQTNRMKKKLLIEREKTRILM